jgi:hypothetical protein
VRPLFASVVATANEAAASEGSLAP